MRGEFIRRHRTQKGYTQAHVARLLGVEESAYSKREGTGTGLDSVEKLYELAQILDIDFIELIRVGCPQPDPNRNTLLDTIVHSAELLRNMN
jgi:transcriptional regulator with XRE-family HTH domain